MKALLMGPLLGALATMVFSVGALSADDGISGVAYDPASQQSNLVQIASTSVVAPERVVWRDDGEALYVVSQTGSPVEGLSTTVSRFDVAQGSLENLLSLQPNENVLDVSSQALVAVMRDFDTLVLVDANTKQESAPLVESRTVSSASFSPDGNTLAIVLDNGSVLQLWDVESRQMTGEYTSPSLAEGAFSATFSPSGNSLTWFSPMGGQALDLASGKFGPFISFTSGIYDVEMCSDTSLLVALDDGTLSLWNTTTAVQLQSEDHRQVFSNDCADHGDRLVVTSKNNVGVLELPSFSIDQWLAIAALDASFSPDGSRIAVVGATGEISVWEHR